MRALLLALIPCAALADPTIYIQAGAGHQIGIVERTTIDGERFRTEHTTDMPSWVADFQIGVQYRGFFAQGQHVSSWETHRDHGFNVVTVGYRWEFSF